MIESAYKSGPSRRGSYQVVLPDPKPKVVAAWLDELPLANLLYCFDAIEGALEYFNADLGIHAGTRLELAKLMTPVVSMLVEQAEAHFIDAPLPYHPKAEFYSSLAYRLQFGLGMAYALSAFEVKPSSGWFGPSGNQPLTAVYRAFQHLGLAQLRVAQQYLTPSLEFWAMLFRLYYHAEAKGLLQKYYDEPSEPEACRTPLGLFKRSLMFDLASTRHLRQREMARAFELLGALSDHAKWGNNPAQDWHSAEFVIHLDQVRPPARNPPGSLPGGDGNRFLYTLDLVRMVERFAEDSRQGIGRDRHGLDEVVLDSIARNLQGIQKRKADRKLLDTACRCVVGLNRLIAALSQPDRFWGQPPASKSAPKAKPSRPLDIMPERDLDTEEIDLRSEITLPKLLRRGQITREDIWIAVEDKWKGGVTAGTVVEGRIANAGIHDYCIVWPMGKVAEIKVGELIGIRDEGHALFIGVIRWLHCGEGRVRFGVEMLTLAGEVLEVLDSNMKPVALGLLLPPEAGLRETPELLTLPGKVHPGAAARVGDGSEGQFYRVYSLIKNAASFSRFSLTPAKIG